MAEAYQRQIENIAQRIRELRLERGLTVQEVAYRCDMERSNLSRIELGQANPTLRTLCAICNALGVELNELMQ